MRPDRNTLPEGAAATVERTVSEADTCAAQLARPKDPSARVFALSGLAALCDAASARILEPYLMAGETSLCVGLDLAVEAPAPVGGLVRATAIYRGSEEKHYLFDVTVFDAYGELAKGLLKRSITPVARVEAAAAKRLA